MIILAVREHPHAGTIVHVRIENLRQDWPRHVSEPRTVSHLAFAENALQASVGTRVGRRNAEELDTWVLQEELPKTVVVAPVAEALDALYEQTKLLLQEPLPAFLPKDPDPETETDVSKVELQIICEVPATKAFGERRVRYELLGQGCNDLKSLNKALSVLAASPRGNKPWKFMVEPQEGVTYGDVALVVDALLRVGFKDIGFGGKLGSKK